MILFCAPFSDLSSFRNLYDAKETRGKKFIVNQHCIEIPIFAFSSFSAPLSVMISVQIQTDTYLHKCTLKKLFIDYKKVEMGNILCCKIAIQNLTLNDVIVINIYIEIGLLFAY